jgi:N-acetylglucosamine kinase
MISAGIDIGGTKLETQIFRDGWLHAEKMRWSTPQTYEALVDALAEAVRWCLGHGVSESKIGISCAGLYNPVTGLSLTSNLPATGKPLRADVERHAGFALTWINDCRALALSEATFGAAVGSNPALGLIIGTGLAGGVVVNGTLLPSHARVGGEFGHIPLPAGPMLEHGLPVVRCGCGRLGCCETLISAPGLSRIGAHVTGRFLKPEDITINRFHDADAARIWAIWLELAAEFLVTLCFATDPEVIVIGGGLSKARDIASDLQGALRRSALEGFPIPAIRVAEGGDASGARGAAYAAVTGLRHG